MRTIDIQLVGGEKMLVSILEGHNTVASFYMPQIGGAFKFPTDSIPVERQDELTAICRAYKCGLLRIGFKHDLGGDAIQQQSYFWDKIAPIAARSFIGFETCEHTGSVFYTTPTQKFPFGGAFTPHWEGHQLTPVRKYLTDDGSECEDGGIMNYAVDMTVDPFTEAVRYLRCVLDYVGE